MRIYTKRMVKHTKAINVKLSEQQHDTLMEIRKASGKNVSELIRQNLDFFSHYYLSKNKFPESR